MTFLREFLVLHWIFSLLLVCTCVLCLYLRMLINCECILCIIFFHLWPAMLDPTLTCEALTLSFVQSSQVACRINQNSIPRSDSKSWKLDMTSTVKTPIFAQNFPSHFVCQGIACVTEVWDTWQRAFSSYVWWGQTPLLAAYEYKESYSFFLP